MAVVNLVVQYLLWCHGSGESTSNYWWCHGTGESTSTYWFCDGSGASSSTVLTGGVTVVVRLAVQYLLVVSCSVLLAHTEYS